MSHWSPQDWVIFLSAAGTFLGVVTTLALKIIAAVKESTATVAANTADRAVKAAESNAKLDTVVSAVTGAPPMPPA